MVSAGLKGGINNINVVGSNFGQGNQLNAPSEETPTPTPSEPTPEPTPQLQPFFTPQDVKFQDTMDLRISADKKLLVKPTSLLARTLGDKIQDQETYNKFFDPLVKDLQKGDDYGFDVDRLYRNIRKEGFEPYKDVITKFGGQPFGGKRCIRRRRCLQQFCEPTICKR